MFDLSSSPTIDLAAAETLAELHGHLADRGVGLRLANADSHVVSVFDSAGIVESLGGVAEDRAIADVVDVG